MDIGAMGQWGIRVVYTYMENELPRAWVRGGETRRYAGERRKLSQELRPRQKLRRRRGRRQDRMCVRGDSEAERRWGERWTMRVWMSVAESEKMIEDTSSRVGKAAVDLREIVVRTGAIEAFRRPLMSLRRLSQSSTPKS